MDSNEDIKLVFFVYKLEFNYYLHSFLINAVAFRVIDLGNSIASIPFKIML